MTAKNLKHQVGLERWRARICDCRSSGLRVKAWCKEQGVTTTAYYKWERIVLDEANAVQSVAHPSPVFAELPAPASFPKKNIVATVHIGLASLDVYSGADAEIVIALCHALSHVE